MTVPADLDRRFRDAAVALGLVELAYDVLETPIGPLLVAAGDHGLVRITFGGDERADELAAVAGPRVLRAPRAVANAKRELDEYFAGRRRAFDLSVDLRRAAPFTRTVLEQLAAVPYGETTTYATLAARAGNPRASRAVGTVMNRNPLPIVLPCHRVVGSNGSLVGYAGGLDTKRALLTLEGALAPELL